MQESHNLCIRYQFIDANGQVYITKQLSNLGDKGKLSYTLKLG